MKMMIKTHLCKIPEKILPSQTSTRKINLGVGPLFIHLVTKWPFEIIYSLDFQLLLRFLYMYSLWQVHIPLCAWSKWNPRKFCYQGPPEPKNLEIHVGACFLGNLSNCGRQVAYHIYQYIDIHSSSCDEDTKNTLSYRPTNIFLRYSMLFLGRDVRLSELCTHIQKRVRKIRYKQDPSCCQLSRQ